MNPKVKYMWKAPYFVMTFDGSLTISQCCENKIKFFTNLNQKCCVTQNKIK